MSNNRIFQIFSSHKILLIILLIAGALRLIKLGSIPPHLTPDEAALGYNAYSILHTGRDEYGQLLPLVFKSFGDYKPGLYVYLSAPFILLLGLSEWAVRLPGALSGILAIPLVYLVAGQVNFKKGTRHAKIFPIMAAFALAIMPWHVMFSRGAWEANLSLTLTLAGIYLFILSFKNKKFLYYSAFVFALTFYAYQGAKLSTPIAALVLLLVFKDKLSNIKRDTLLKAALFLALMVMPLLAGLFSEAGGRLNVFSVFAYPRESSYVEDQMAAAGILQGSAPYFLFYSESYYFLRMIALRWFNHFSGAFLFFEGDWQNPRHTPPYHGVLLISDIIILALGVVFLIRSDNKKLKLLTLAWLLLAPLPSALSRDEVNAVRALSMAVPLSFLLAFGYSLITEKRKAVALAVALLTFGGFIYFADLYFMHMPNLNATYWQVGYKDAMQDVARLQPEYQSVTVEQSYNQPYIFYLFYNKYDPTRYQQSAELHKEGPDVGLIERLDNIHFRYFAWPDEVSDEGTLYVSGPFQGHKPREASERVEVIKEIYYPSGGKAFIISKPK